MYQLRNTMHDLCYSPDNVPDSLFEQCVKYLGRNISILSNSDPVTKSLRLKEGLNLPTVICEKLIEVYQQNGTVIDDNFVGLFKNPEAARLKRIKLRNSTITDAGLSILVNSSPTELEIINCKELTMNSLNDINKKGENLIVLTLGSSTQILPKHGISDFSEQGYILNTPNLKKLTVGKIHIQWEKYFSLLLMPLKKLTYLDLSGCFDVGNLSYLVNLPNLTSLILFNIQRLETAIDSIIKLINLRHLDISQSNETQGNFKFPKEFLTKLIENLPNLIYLDISGTNLAGKGIPGGSFTDGSGFESRANQTFEFLGLYKTPYEACKRHNIPAKKISGDANESQTLTALEAYLDRTDFLGNILSDLYHLFSHEKCDNVDVALVLLLEAMDSHLHEKNIQINASASLFYIAELIAKRPFFNIKLKHHLISTLINAMGAFQNDETVLRNACLTLMRFDACDYTLFDYERLVFLLLYVVSEMENHSLVQRVGIFLLNSLACQVDEAQKQLLGDLGTVNRMLGLIRDRWQRNICDDVMEVAWSTVWNVTDETFENCQRFLEEEGMKLFLGCLSAFPTRKELLKNMMGLLGNVAEMKSLRPLLMNERFVSVFTDLLGFLSEEIEVSYNAAGVLAHMCSDGVESWTIEEPKRDDVLKKIVWAINRWDLVTERNINYRSFQPIFGLLKVTHTEECQLWAAWALANLTTVYRDKYCPLVLKEGGIELLQSVMKTEHSHQAINELAKIVINNCTEE